jgi:hypothetical protein
MDMGTSPQALKDGRPALHLHNLPQTCEVALSARSYDEVDAIRLRDDLVAAKDKELWMVEAQRAKLCEQLDQVETEVERMQQDLLAKEVFLSQKKAEVDRLKHEQKQLQAKVAKAKGQEQAMQVVSKQNASLLQLLQAQEQETLQQCKARKALQAELDELKLKYRHHVETAARVEAEMLKEKAEAAAEKRQLALLHEKAVREHAATKKALEETVAEQALSVETIQDELRQRRAKQ